LKLLIAGWHVQSETWGTEAMDNEKDCRHVRDRRWCCHWIYFQSGKSDFSWFHRTQAFSLYFTHRDAFGSIYSRLNSARWYARFKVLLKCPTHFFTFQKCRISFMLSGSTIVCNSSRPRILTPEKCRLIWLASSTARTRALSWGNCGNFWMTLRTMQLGFLKSLLTKKWLIWVSKRFDLFVCAFVRVSKYFFC